MGDYSLCKHDTAIGYCDICSPTWREDLDKANLFDSVYEAGICRGISEKCGELQAKIDALMLEFCPDDMTKEQLANWEAHQRCAP